MSRSKEFAEAAGKAIARPVTSTANMIVHPVETISGIPDGEGRMYDRVKLGTQTVYESATAKDTKRQRKGGRRLEARGRHHRERARLREGAPGPGQGSQHRPLHHQHGGLRHAAGDLINQAQAASASTGASESAVATLMKTRSTRWASSSPWRRAVSVCRT